MTHSAVLILCSCPLELSSSIVCVWARGQHQSSNHLEWMSDPTRGCSRTTILSLWRKLQPVDKRREWNDDSSPLFEFVLLFPFRYPLSPFRSNRTKIFTEFPTVFMRTLPNEFYALGYVLVKCPTVLWVLNAFHCPKSYRCRERTSFNHCLADHHKKQNRLELQCHSEHIEPSPFPSHPFTRSLWSFNGVTPKILDCIE
jgi:hypothetical protein